MFLKKLLILITLTYGNLFSNTFEYQTIFNRANRLYGDGQKNEALEIYNSIIGSGINSGSVYYNIGNIYMDSGQYALAILYYEKSLRLLGYDKQLLNNIRLAYESVGHNRFYQAYNVRYLYLFFYLKNITLILILILLMLIVITSFLHIFNIGFFVTKVGKFTIKKFYSILSSIFLLSFMIYLYSSYLLTQNFLIVQESGAYVREGRSDSAKNIYNLSLGEKILVKEAHENWYYVKLDNNGYGWIRSIDVQGIL